MFGVDWQVSDVDRSCAAGASAGGGASAAAGSAGRQSVAQVLGKRLRRLQQRLGLKQVSAKALRLGQAKAGGRFHLDAQRRVLVSILGRITLLLKRPQNSLSPSPTREHIIRKRFRKSRCTNMAVESVKEQNKFFTFTILN